MLKQIFFLFLLIILCFSIPAQELIVEYLDGIVEIKDINVWIELYIGDEISQAAIIRLDEESMAEINGEELNILLTKPGIYRINEIIEDLKEVSGWEIASLIENKVQFLLEGGDESENAAAMGVRGDAAEEEIEWLDDDYINDLLIMGKENLADKDYEEALSLFEEAFDSVDEENASVFLFYLAYTYSLMDNHAKALSYLEDAEFESYESLYFDYKILLGKIYINGLLFRMALEVLEEALLNEEDLIDEEIQTINFLMSFCYQGLGDMDKAIRFLKVARNILPDSEIGIKAGNILADI